ncbi:ribose-5-phosphate isomerase RpiA [Candidatus Liberibacter americanus]|uniref:Ribose-5-phosphate isomerase A n=1 Tax=Candidatus Liberibacter americanus str. Sao Paulo TaxID=1261131 RepID=U6B5B2_9HYPH|nr:ribose-5-phosphate isomerase RpiA [Candidatus Liberibacter americanus]AHA28110.1 Ribose 5-phosphate isomerase [Candidatus Liberibacter americanus str. Sao Paulo]EMS36043.1 ribose-5-phosphate isomerase A [Candidatus Liberibacter americanus PW_SP]
MESLHMKRNAARQAIQYVEDGMILGMGTGTTSKEFMLLLAQKIMDGLSVEAVATSVDTENFCKKNNIPLLSIEDVSCIDLSIDGFDEVDFRLRFIKGYGGALLREKIIANASSRVIFIGDESKISNPIGQGILPIEIDQFGIKATISALKKLAFQFGLNEKFLLRRNGSDLFVSDGGNYIIDAYFGFIPDPGFISDALYAIPGVVEHGMFIGMAECAIVGMYDGTCSILKA